MQLEGVQAVLSAYRQGVEAWLRMTTEGYPVRRLFEEVATHPEPCSTAHLKQPEADWPWVR